MSGMRSLLLAAAVFASACTSVDPMVGSYNITVTGMDNQTAPTTSSSTVSGTGFLTINASKMDPQQYFLVFGQDTYFCSLKGTKSTSAALEIDIADMQSCKVGNFTFVTTDGKVTLDKDTMTTASLTVSYTYSGQVVFNISGTGTRTFAGPKQ